MPYDWKMIIRTLQDTCLMSQADIADKIGVRQSAISHILTGRRSPSMRTKRLLMDLAVKMKVNIRNS